MPYPVSTGTLGGAQYWFRDYTIRRRFRSDKVSLKSWRGTFMLRMIEHFFETVEANIGCAVFAVLTSFVMTGCLQQIWE
jgi:hypothetical protein